MLRLHPAGVACPELVEGLRTNGRVEVAATIERDRDFGTVLALSTPQRGERVVRALPATADDLRGALEEIAGARMPESTVERLREFAASETPGDRIELGATA